MGAPTRRARLRADTVGEIKAAALAQLREVGAGQLSLRAVATGLGMSPAGLYRYFDGRDALLTALIADVFDALADAVEQARDREPGADVADRLLAAALAYRHWAVTHPQEFGLVYGTPVPGYAAPVDGPTSVATRRVGTAFVQLMVQAWRTGRLRTPAEVAPASEVLATFARALHPDLPPAAALAALAGWSRIHGFTVFETFGHLRWLGSDTAPLAEAGFRALVADLIRPIGRPVVPARPTAGPGEGVRSARRRAPRS